MAIFGKSADGKGRTVLDILLKRNKRDMTSQEFQYHNPLQAKIGCSVNIEHVSEFAGLNFFLQAIHVWETKIGNKNYYHTDYLLKATRLAEDPVKVKLRLIPDENVASELGHKIQVLSNYCEMGWNQANEANLPEALIQETLQIYQDEEGNDYYEDDRPTYWRVDDVTEPYHSRVTILKDLDGDGAVQADELDHLNMTLWDYHRNTTDLETGQEFREYLSIEMDEGTSYYEFYRGKDVEPFQVVVI